MRVAGSDWSPWRIVSAGRLDDACQPASILGTLGDGRAAIEAGEWAAAAVGVVAAILSSETGAPGGAAARQALTRSAREIARIASSKTALAKLMETAISDLADGAAETATARLMFDCVGYGAGLTRPDTATLGQRPSASTRERAHNSAASTSTRPSRTSAPS